MSANNSGGKKPPLKSSNAGIASEEVAAQLSNRYKTLSDLWVQAEKKFSQYPISDPVIHRYATEDFCDSHGDYLYSILKYICYRKYGDNWRICVGFENSEHPEDGIDFKPIVERSVEDRIEAASHLPALHSAILAAIKKSIGKLDEAIHHINGFLQGAEE